MLRSVRAAVAACALGALALGGSIPAHADSEFVVALPTFYVIAPGSDNSVAPITHAVAQRVQALFDAAAGKGQVWVIARLGWSPDDLYNQCANDPTKSADGKQQNVIGGLILDGTNSYTSGPDSYILWVRNWAKIATNAELVECQNSGFAKPAITWMTPNLNGYGAQNGFPIEVGAVAGLYLGSNNNSDARAIAIGSSLSAIDSTTAVPPVSDAVSLRAAADRVANDLIQKLTDSCKSPPLRMAAMCVRLGLAPATTPIATPAPTPKPTPS